MKRVKYLLSPDHGVRTTVQEAAEVSNPGMKRLSDENARYRVRLKDLEAKHAKLMDDHQFLLERFVTLEILTDIRDRIRTWNR